MKKPVAAKNRRELAKEIRVQEDLAAAKSRSQSVLEREYTVPPLRVNERGLPVTKLDQKWVQL